MSITRFGILALLIVSVAIIICLVVYKLSETSGVYNRVGYTHCTEKPLNLPHRTAFSTLGIKFLSPDQIINLAHKPGQESQKIIYIPCNYNNSDVDIQSFFRGKRLLGSDNQVRWLTTAVLGCNKLCAKNGLWMVLETTYGRQNAKKIIPESWVIPTPITGIQRIIGKSGRQWEEPPTLIFKKNIQGKQGLLLTNSPVEIRKLISGAVGSNKYSVAQRYLEQPYLIHGRKLNIRLYVLVVAAATGSSWWLYRAGKCIYTNRKYEPLPADTTIRSGDIALMDLLEQHFTSLNLDTQMVYGEERCPESLAELQAYMLSRGEDWLRIWKKIQLGLKKVARAYSGKLTAYKDSTAYQIFGVDYILTRSPNTNDDATEITPYLLEFNKGPEMKYKSPHDKELKCGLQRDILELVLGQDHHSKKHGKWHLLNSINKSKGKTQP